MKTEERPGKDRRFEDYALSRQEYMNVMVHFYRGEVHRSTVWRERLDATTNWAVLTTAAMMSFSFASEEHHHIMLLMTNFVILAYLFIEARRFRYFEVYRARVRMLEENFLIPVITRELESPMHSWREMVAMDLDMPKYKTTLVEAVGFRLRRNYLIIFMIVLGAWLLKVVMHPVPAGSWGEVWTRMAVGTVPPAMVLGAGLLFYMAMLGVTWYARHIHGGAPQDEIAGLERNLDQWKI
jgi:uncharacterized membrane protein